MTNKQTIPFQACGLLATAAMGFGVQVSLVLFCCFLSTAA